MSQHNSDFYFFNPQLQYVSCQSVKSSDLLTKTWAKRLKCNVQFQRLYFEDDWSACQFYFQPANRSCSSKSHMCSSHTEMRLDVDLFYWDELGLEKLITGPPQVTRHTLRCRFE